jgi:hypothetical protein
MPLTRFRSWFRRMFSRRGLRRAARRCRPRPEALEERTLLATGLGLGSSPAVNHSFLNATAAIAPNDVWAVGEFLSPSTNTFQPLAEHFNGTSWSVVSTPALPPGNFGELFGVAAVSSTDVWAVGETGNLSPFSPLIEHWDGTQWSIVTGPPASSPLNAVTAISATDVWAVGQNNLIENFNGTSWSIVPAPNTGFGLDANLSGVSGTSATDVWAVGGIGRHPAVQVLHWDGTTWSVVPAPSPAFDSSLHSVVALSPTNVWAVGTDNSGPTRTLIEQWNGTVWAVVPSPNVGGNSVNANNSLTGVAAVSATDVWAVGSSTNTRTGFGRTLTLNFNGTNWSVVPSPNATNNGQDALNGVTALNTGTVVAVGFAINGATGATNGLILQSAAASAAPSPGGTPALTVTAPAAGTSPSLVPGRAVPVGKGSKGPGRRTGHDAASGFATGGTADGDGLPS